MHGADHAAGDKRARAKLNAARIEHQQHVTKIGGGMILDKGPCSVPDCSGEYHVTDPEDFCPTHRAAFADVIGHPGNTTIKIASTNNVEPLKYMI
jgi:hypothetical protein